MNSVLLTTWEFRYLDVAMRVHRISCKHQGDITIRQFPGGGIGTVTQVLCGCGAELDVTDYESW